jgi:hypothetical protein
VQFPPRTEYGRRAILGRLRRRDATSAAGSARIARSGGRFHRVELRDYIGRELDRGRNLFDVLGDPHVWARFEEDPLLLSKVARDERVMSALAKDQADSSRVLPNGGGGVVR